MKLAKHRIQSLLAVRPLERIYAGRVLGADGGDVIVRQLLPGLPREEYAETAQVFQRHMRRISALGHPGTLPVREFVSGDLGAYYYVTDVPVGITLGELVAATGSLPVPTASALGVAMGECLAYAHGNGVHHLALNRFQVLLSDAPSVTLLEMGLVPLLLERVEGRLRHVHSAWNHLFPEAGAVAPELIISESAGAHTDVYGLGVMLYLLATAVLPYTGQAVVIYNSVVAATTPPDPRAEISNLSAEFSELVSQCLARNPSERPQSVADVVDRLRPMALPLADALAGYTPVIHATNYLDRFEPLLRVVSDVEVAEKSPEPPPSPAVIPLFAPAETLDDSRILSQMTPQQQHIYLRKMYGVSGPTGRRGLWVVLLLIIAVALVMLMPKFWSSTSSDEPASTSTIVPNEEASSPTGHSSRYRRPGDTLERKRDRRRIELH